MNRQLLLCIAVLTMGVLPLVVSACPLGQGRLGSVTPTYAGCLAGPTGGAVQFWDAERGDTYTLTLTNVFDCANGGTAPSINVRINSAAPGYGNVDLVAYYVSPGTYRFNYYLPANAVCTMPVFYCTTPGVGSSGKYVRRSEGLAFQAHLRAAHFDGGCQYPVEVSSGSCGAVPAEDSSWGAIKALYE